MRCGCARACQHGLPCVEMVMSSTPNQTIVTERGTDLGRQVLGSAPARCSESDSHIYGVNEMITEMVLQRLENQGLELRIYRRSPGGTIEAEKTYLVEPNRGNWVVKSAFGIVKHGGVTSINPGKSRPLP
ncbi:unnamed protein product [Prunus armeniaca]